MRKIRIISQISKVFWWPRWESRYFDDWGYFLLTSFSLIDVRQLCRYTLLFQCTMRKFQETQANFKLLPTIYIAFLFSVTLKMKKMYLNIWLFKIVSSMRRFNPFVHFWVFHLEESLTHPLFVCRRGQRRVERALCVNGLENHLFVIALVIDILGQ